MSGFSIFRRKSARVVAVLAAATFAISSTAAGATCGLCDTQVVLNQELATCFLSKYGDLAKAEEPAIAVDLSGCEEQRSIVEPLPSPNVNADEPDTEFLISRGQLDCLKKKLEEPGIVLDPSAKIDLAACG